MMSVQFLFANTIIHIGSFVLFSLICLVVYNLVFGRKMPKEAFFVWLAVLVAFSWVTISSNSSPRFVLTDESGSPPVYDGDISSDAPEKMTNEDRVNYNRSLIEENKR